MNRLPENGPDTVGNIVLKGIPMAVGEDNLFDPLNEGSHGQGPFCVVAFRADGFHKPSRKIQFIGYFHVTLLE
jgi:hypothetical protein